MSRHRTLVLATRNPGKIGEIRGMLAHTFWLIRSCANFPGCPVPGEVGDTFEENAVRKARVVAQFTGHLTLADDSGLEVDALHGAPGVHSARFTGENATDSSNNAALLKRLEGVPAGRRTARFRCVIALAAPDGSCRTAKGVCEGRILFSPGGTAGFGYDPLFAPDGYALSFAELGAGIKNAISHRAGAMRAAAALLEKFR